MGVSLGLVTLGAPLRRGGGSFSPRDIPDLVLWLEADRGLWQDAARTIPAAADGDPVGAWDDLSGNGRHATQPTASQRPTLRLAQVGGRPAVRFDGVDDILAAPNVTLTAHTAFVIATAGANQMIWEHGPDANTSDGEYLYSSTIRVRRGSSASGKAYPLGLYTSPVVARVRHDGTHAGHNLWHNGSLVTPSGTLGTSNVGTAAVTDTVYIGARSTLTNRLNGIIAALILYTRALTDNECRAVERYLGQKYGISVA